MRAPVRAKSLRPSDVAAEESAVQASDRTMQRHMSLDVLRGLTIGWLLVLVYTPTTGWRGHAGWWGWDLSDAFFPTFLFVAGAGLAVQTRRGIPWARVLRRFVSLVLLGLLVNAWLGAGPDLSELRFTGVLQRIAVAGLVGTCFLALAGRHWRRLMFAAVASAVLWAVVLHLGSRGCPEGLPTPTGCGSFFALDQAVFGREHTWLQGSRGYDPEGIASTLGALASFLAGLSAALLLESQRSRPTAQRGRGILVLAAVWALTTPLFLLAQPVGKRVWTASFVSVSAIGALLLLAVAVMVFDTQHGSAHVQRAVAIGGWPLAALGRNTLILWVGIYTLSRSLTETKVGPGNVPLGEHLLQSYGPWGFAALLLGGWLLVASCMHVARWHIRL